MSNCTTADGIDHGEYELKDCIWAVVHVYEDGYIQCPLQGTDMTCEVCMDLLEERMARKEQ